MDELRLQRAQEELKACVITAERAGLVIYPSAAAWKNTPDITEGATVRRDQTLLLMPDLTKMQVKVGIHESIVDRLSVGMKAKITLGERVLEGSVKSISTVTRPAGWWTGNVVKYDTIVELPPVEDLKPGMSAEVEIVLAEYNDVVMIPVAAIVETSTEQLCWVVTESGLERRSIELGDGSDSYIIVEAGLSTDEVVVLNPTAYVAEAEEEALQSALTE